MSSSTAAMPGLALATESRWLFRLPEMITLFFPLVQLLGQTAANTRSAAGNEDDEIHDVSDLCVSKCGVDVELL